MMARRCVQAGLALILWAGSLSSLHASSPQAVQTPLPSLGQSVTQTYGAYWEVGSGRSSSLLLRNQDRQNAVTGNLILYAADGRVAQTVPLQVAANAVTRIAFADLIKPSADLQSGGLTLQFTGPAAHVQGNVTLENLLNGSRMVLRLQGGLAFDTENALHAPWWLPDSGTDARITLFNASPQTILVSPSLTLAGQEQASDKISLAPHQSKQLHLRSLMQDADVTAGSITLRYDGPAHALQPALLLENTSSGFALAPGFHARHQQSSTASTTWVFPSVVLTSPSATTANPDSKLHSFALLTNGSSAPAVAHFRAYFFDEAANISRNVELPLPSILPFQTEVLDLSQFSDLGLIPQSTSSVGLVAEHTGLPGDVAISVVAVKEGGASRADGIVLSMEGTKFHYLDTISGSGIMPRIENDSSRDVQGALSIYFEDLGGVGTYRMPITIKANGTRSLNLQQIVNAGLPDEMGDVLPTGLIAGMLALDGSDGLQGFSSECAKECGSLSPAFPTTSSTTQAQIHFAAHKAGTASSALAPACAPPPPGCPNSVSLVATTTFDLAPFVPTLKMGIGIAASMQVGSIVEQWDGTQITEAVTEFSNTCPRKEFKGVCDGSSTFTVGASAGTVFGKPFPATHNTYYDFHVGTSPISALDQAGIKGCTAVCKQTYSCGGKVIGNFTITRVFRKAVINGTHVTTITTTKK